MHGGEHHMKSGAGKLKSVYSQDMMSVHTSGKHFGSISSVRVWCPASLQTFDTLLVPQQISQMSIRFLVLAGSYCSCSRAHLHVYEAQSSMSLPPQPLRSTRSCRPQWCPLPAVARRRGQRASVPVRRQQLPWVVLIKWAALLVLCPKP